MKRLHRILALLLVLTMCLSLLPLSALADEAEEEELAVGELEDPPETPEDGDEDADTFCDYAPDDEVTENNNGTTYTVVEVYPEIEATCTQNGRLKGFKLSNGLLYLGDPPVDPVDAYQEASLTRTDSLVIPARHNCVLVDTATCIGSGVSYFKCRYCHLHFKDAACTQLGENPSPKWKHVPGGVYFAEVASTCVAPGNIAYSYCLNCGMMCDLDGNSLGYEDLLLPLAPHMLDHYEEVAPTCMMSGCREYWQCEICGKIFMDEAAGMETRIDDLIVPLDPDAHVWGKWEPVQAPTPTASGISRRVCTLCGAEEIEVVPYTAALGGTIVDIFVESLGDCYTQGNKAGFKLSDGSFYEGVAPGGVEEYIAPEVLAAYTRVGSFADLLTGFNHSPGPCVEIAPTCGEYGWRYWECDACHKRFRDSSLTIEGVQLIPATGQHNWIETDRIEATDTTPGQVRYVCSICGAVKTESIPCTGIIDSSYYLYYVIPNHDTWLRGEDPQLFESDLIGELTAAAGDDGEADEAVYVGVRCGAESAEIPEIDDFIAWDSYIHLKPAYLESLMPGTYLIWVFDKRDPYNKYTNSCLFYVVADPAAEGRATLAPEDTDRFYVNEPENLRFIASEALEPDSVWVDGKPLDPNCCELSNLGQRLTLRASFLGTLKTGTHTVSAVTRRGIAVEAEFHGWYVISASSPVMPSSIPLDHGYLMLHPGDSVQLDTVGLTGYRKESLRWAASSDGAVPGGTNGTTVISVNETGLVTALEAGTAYAVAYYPNYGTAVASCRVDVAGSTPDGRFVEAAISHVRLADPKATVELYSADYTRVELIPVLTQNLEYANAAFEPVRPDPVPEDGGCAIRSVRFVEDDPKNAGLSERFTLHVVDDRTVEIVPTEEAIMGSVRVNGSYKVSLAVAMDIDEQEYTTEPLTITVKKTLPKVAAGAVKLNSFLPNDVQTVVFTGAELGLVRLDPAKTQPGDWLRFDKDSLCVSYEGPLDAARSGKLNLLVKPRGWNVELPVTVSVSAAKSAPKLTLKPNSLNLRPGAKDFSAAEAAVSPEGYSDAESWPLKVLSVKEGRDERPNDLDVRISGHTVFVQEGAVPPKDGKAHTYKVTLALMRRDREDGSFAETSVQTTLTVKLLAASTKVTMSAKAAGSIDTAIPASPATLSVTVSGAGAGAVWLYPEDIRIMKEKSRVQSEDVTGRFEITQTGPTAFTLTEKTPGSLESGYTYTAYITKAPGCHAKLPVKFSSPAKVQPSVTLKAAGAIDVIRPMSEVTITPTVKNCFTYVPGRGDLRILCGGEDVTDDDTLNPFAVSVKDGVFVLRLRVMDNETDYTKEKFKVKLVAQMETVGEDGLVKSVAVSSKELAVTIKMGSAGVAASEKTLTLLSDDCNDQALVTLKATEAALAGIARVEMISPQDKKGHDAFELIPLGSGKYAIGYNGNKLPLPGFKGGTVKLNVFLRGNATGKPNATVSVSVKRG